MMDPVEAVKIIHNAHYVDAMTFIGYITSPKIQKYIADYGIEKFKRQTNFPMAVTGK